MKRVILAVTGTVAGVVALLSFKTQGQTTTATGSLPSAAISSTASTATGGSGSSPVPATSSASSAPGSSSAAPSSSAAVASKSYIGSAITTRYGVVQVKVTVKGSTITNVSFVQLTSHDGRSQQINSDAAPQLLQETLSAQSANIDTVSGASYTSDGYRQSLQSALDQARAA